MKLSVFKIAIIAQVIELLSNSSQDFGKVAILLQLFNLPNWSVNIHPQSHLASTVGIDCFFLSYFSFFLVPQACYTNDIHNGTAVTEMPTLNMQHCQYQCQTNPTCQFFMFQYSLARCYLKSDDGSQGYPGNGDFISGPKYCPGQCKLCFSVFCQFHLILS